MDIPIWQYVVSMLGYTVFLLLFVEFNRKHLKLAAIFWILSLFTFPLWKENLFGWFRWAKTISVLGPTALIVGIARIAHLYKKEGWWQFFRKDWVLWALYGVLFLNIAEATMKDFATSNYFNAIAGLVLCITIPWPKYKGIKQRFWGFSKGKPGDLLAYTTFAWNFLYTTWNLAFVYGENTGFFASSMCILMAAELYPIIKNRPELYIIARVYTLAFHILIRSTYDVFTPIMDSSSWANETVLYAWGAINMVLHVPYGIWWIMKYYKSKKEGIPLPLKSMESQTV
jgi:hypothetical protein